MIKRTIYALGFFDGVHLGHQALLRSCRELADQHDCEAVAVTFTAHPDALVFGKAPGLLNTNKDRISLLCAYGMDSVLEIPFDRALMTTHWSSFLKQLVDSGAAGFVCGSDFRFGADSRGTAKKLAAFCKSRQLCWAVVPEQTMDGERISSTRIRRFLEQGDLAQVNRLLGHPYILTGPVVSGQQLGRTIGIPTANLQLPEELIPPRLGVYACKCLVDGREYLAVTNVGTRPTVNGSNISVEVHLLDFEGNLYGKPLTVAFCQFLRPEKKFPSLEELQKEIQKNTLQTRKFFEKSI